MSIAISPTRKFNFVSTVDPEISVTMTFLSIEDATRSSNEETGQQIFQRLLRKSITDFTGVVDQITGKKPELNEDVQRTIFQWIVTDDKEMFNQIQEAYSGITEKKYLSGVEQLELGIGDQASV